MTSTTEFQQWFDDERNGNAQAVFVQLTHSPLEGDALYRRSVRADCGAVASFTGTTRDTFEGKKVLKLSYEAYRDMAVASMRALGLAVLSRHTDCRCVVVAHRLGEVPVGDASVIIHVSSAHRRAALAAVAEAIDELKASVPVFKKEIFEDGTASWKHNPEFPPGGGKN